MEELKHIYDHIELSTDTDTEDERDFFFRK